MFFLKYHKLDTFFLSLLALAIFLLWWPTRLLPYWWDSAGYIMQAARFYIDTNFSSFILPSDSSLSVMAHPPFFPFLLAIVWKIFGDSLLVSHLFYLPFVFAAVLATYILGRHISAFQDERMNSFVGFASALLLIATPLFAAHIGIIYTEIPTAAFAVWAVYFFLKRQRLLYFLCASLMLLMKEVSLVVLLSIGFVYFWAFIFSSIKDKTDIARKSIVFCKDLAFFMSPALVLAAWFAWHYAATGWLFSLPYYEKTFNEEILSVSWQKIGFVLKFFFLEQNRWVASVFVGGALFVLAARQKFRELFFASRAEGLVLACLIAIAVPVLFGKLEFLPRYVIFGLPFLFIFFSVLLGHLLQRRFPHDPVSASKKIVFFSAVTVLVFLFSLAWDTHRQVKTFYFAPMEENVEYIDILSVGKQMARFIETNYPEAKIYTSFPANYMLRYPYQGFVSRPILTEDCHNYKEGDEVEVVVFHLLSPPSVQCRDLIARFNLVPLEEGAFARNGKWMQAYVAAPVSQD